MTSDEAEAVFKRVLPAEARAVAVSLADAPSEWPLPPELKKAKASRVREFIAGRWCAARVLALLGVTGEVGRRDDRAPSWPMGIAGAITHTKALAAAAAGRLDGLGIDVEPVLSNEALADLRVTAIDDDEWRVLGEDLAIATAVFSAKETLFKCEYPRKGVWLDFTDAKLVSRDEGQLVFRVLGAERAVRYALEHGHAFTALAV
ncbi:MAG: 4'-phosphopantetheinyl transferase superfamily protein [Myxococcaceae bacterium]|nr:4'-phosphopantetheinyl transferase superfamily protein [Myxococcaceae bacterium]